MCQISLQASTCPCIFQARFAEVKRDCRADWLISGLPNCVHLKNRRRLVGVGPAGGRLKNGAQGRGARRHLFELVAEP